MQSSNSELRLRPQTKGGLTSILPRATCRICPALLRLGIAAGFCFGATLASAQFDQRNDSSDANLLNSISELGAVGQEFVPQSNLVTTVGLFTADFDADAHAGAQLYVNIHDDTITNSIVGVSSLVVLPDRFAGVTWFPFTPPLSLVPNHRYVIEVVQVSGDNWAVGRTGVDLTDSYPAGGPITLGSVESDGTADLWFREGIPPPCFPAGLQAQLSTNSVVLSWSNPNYRLQAAASLGTAPGPLWTDIFQPSPVTVTFDSGLGFFRLVCP
jgi:hypothetical protein